MIDKPNRKKRTQSKDLPTKDKKLSTDDMKQIKGGAVTATRAGGPTSARAPLVDAHGCPACPHPAKLL